MMNVGCFFRSVSDFRRTQTPSPGGRWPREARSDEGRGALSFCFAFRNCSQTLIRPSVRTGAPSPRGKAFLVHRHAKRFPKQKGTLTPNDWDESTVHTSWCHPSSKSFALPLCRSFRGGVRRFREVLLYARSTDVLHAYARRNLSAMDFLSARVFCALLLPCRRGYEVCCLLLSGSFWT